MEMHQIRYFLAVSRTLNFTRAAEECNVAQPSLTRAVKLLEEELGGELFRRERNLSHLTDLGMRMLPLVQQCYDSALGAKALASAMKSGKIAPLALALSRTVNIELVVPQLSELTRTFKGLELKFQRGTGDEIAEALKQGEVELALAGPLGAAWARLDSWPLFNETFALLVGDKHRLAGRNTAVLTDLQGQKLLVRAYCEQAEPLAAQLRAGGIEVGHGHTVANESDLVSLLSANVGVAIAPRSALLPQGVVRVPIDGLDLARSVSVYGVAGRARSPAAAALLKLLRASDWSRYAV